MIAAPSGVSYDRQVRPRDHSLRYRLTRGNQVSPDQQRHGILARVQPARATAFQEALQSAERIRIRALYAAAEADSPSSTNMERGHRQPTWLGEGPQAPCHSRSPCFQASTIARHCLRCSEDFRRRTEPEFLFAMSASPLHCDAALIVHRNKTTKPSSGAPPSFRQGQYACGGLANRRAAFRATPDRCSRPNARTACPGRAASLDPSSRGTSRIHQFRG
jgi:hypothetical protein